MNSANQDTFSSYPQKNFQGQLSSYKESKDILYEDEIAQEESHLQIAKKFLKIANGKAKNVLIRVPDAKKNIGTSQTITSSVYYTPVTSFRNSKEKELKEEAQRMKSIKQDYFQKTDQFPEHLAVDFKEMLEPKQIDKHYTIKVARADSNAEEFFRSRNLTVTESQQFMLQILQGFEELHEAGFAYGDVKLENFLIFQDKIKLSDFGKSRKITQEAYRNYSGNTRFMPPEGKLSLSGDIYGIGLVLIRIFEEPFLHHNGTLYAKDPSKNTSKFRGIEKHVTEMDTCLGTTSGGLESMGCRIKALVSPLKSQIKQRQATELKNYIDYLSDTLKTAYESKGVDELIELIRNMTRLVPESRPQISQVIKRYKNINLQPKGVQN